MMKPVEYRVPVPADAPGLFQLEQQCFPSPWSMDEISALINRDLSVFTLAAFQGNRAVGYVSVTFSEPGVLHVISICVSPDQRKNGTGGTLLSSALQWGRYLEARRVVLEVRQGNSSAISFYSGRGFRACETIENFYGPGINGIFMERDLSPVQGVLDTILFLANRMNTRPVLGVVLGSGLGWLADRFGCGKVIPFEDIPGMAGRAVQGHAHRLQTSSDGRIVFVMGRRHHYQGYSGSGIVKLPAALAAMGVSNWLLTTSSGAVRQGMQVGDAMVFRDHVNFSGCIPDEPPFFQNGPVYSPTLRNIACDVLGNSEEGVFACVSGPAYETSSEVDLIRHSGCTAVSMSTVQEALALRSLGCRVLGLSLITNAVDGGDSVCHEEVLSAQEMIREKQEKDLIALLERLVVS